MLELAKGPHPLEWSCTVVSQPDIVGVTAQRKLKDNWHQRHLHDVCAIGL
jgi:hypothetical protein